MCVCIVIGVYIYNILYIYIYIMATVNNENQLCTHKLILIIHTHICMHVYKRNITTINMCMYT